MFVKINCDALYVLRVGEQSNIKCEPCCAWELRSLAESSTKKSNKGTLNLGKPASFILCSHRPFVEKMSEYWKSTPRYWCKHCAVYIRDTKLERANHEATARHQGNLNRSLRDLHRGHERQERDKDRARQEIERLNGVIPGSDTAGAASASSSGGKHGATSSKTVTVAPTQASLQKQREQLAELGISMPDTVRPEMAMPGEWTVTNTRIIETKSEAGEEQRVETVATGVRKREVTEDEKETEDAIQGLFKKPRRWGRDSKTMPAEEDKELDALLSGSLTSVKWETQGEEKPTMKAEEASASNEVKKEEEENDAQASLVEAEPVDGTSGITSPAPDNDAAPAVVFKKRKPKGLRSK